MTPHTPRVLDAIDPGVAYFALARFRDKVLTLACLKPIQSVEGVFMDGIDLAIEKPQIYKRGKARKSDIADLLWSGGRISAAYRSARVTAWLPADWKGQVPKRIHHRRIFDALDVEEQRLLFGWTKADKGHIMDAIGLGLVHLGRMPRP